jgi:hypothetical protein
MKGKKRVVTVVAKKETVEITMKVDVLFPSGQLMLNEQETTIDGFKDSIYELLKDTFHYSQIQIK